MEAYIVRAASADDVSLIRELAEASWWPAYRDILSAGQIRYMLNEIYSEDALVRQMQEGQRFLILSRKSSGDDGAESAARGAPGAAPLGFAAFACQDPDAWKLHKIYLLPAARGKGLGRLLLEEVEARVRREGGKTLDLNVNRNNPARLFYEKMGYAVHHEEDVPIGPYLMNDYVMRKVLGRPQAPGGQA